MFCSKNALEIDAKFRFWYQAMVVWWFQREQKLINSLNLAQYHKQNLAMITKSSFIKNINTCLIDSPGAQPKWPPWSCIFAMILEFSHWFASCIFLCLANHCKGMWYGTLSSSSDIVKNTGFCYIENVNELV